MNKNILGFWKAIKESFKEGYSLGLQDKKYSEIKEEGVVVKAGYLSESMICKSKEVVCKMRKWWKEQRTVTTVGTEEEHKVNVTRVVRHLLGNAVNGVAFFVSVVVFGLWSWVTFCVAANWVIDLLYV